MIPVRKVRQQVARNPVARAVARQKLHAALVDQKIRLYMLAEGEACAEFMDGLSLTLATIGAAAALQGLNDDGLLPGLHACQRLMELDSFDPTQATAIDVALSAAEQLNPKLSADNIHDAWLWVNQKGTK